MTPDQLLKQGEQLIAQTKAQGTQSFAGSSYDTLDSSTISPVAPLRITNPTTTSDAVNFQGFLESAAQNQKTTFDTYTQNLQQQSLVAEKEKSKSLKDYLGGLLGQKGETQLTAEAYAQQNGVDAVQKELNDINQQILQEQVGLQRQVEAIEKNPEGKFGGAIAQDVAKARTESLRRQADLSVIQMGIQGRYDSAKAIADRSIAVQLEKQKNLNEALRLNYEENKDLFTLKEQRAFESAQSDRERELAQKEADMKQISDLSIEALKAGVSTQVVSAIRNSRTPAEAMSLLASTGIFAPKAPAISTQVIEVGGKKFLINSKTGETIKEFGVGDTNDITQQSQGKANIDLITGLVKDKKLSTAVGPNPLARVSFTEPLTAARSNYIAGVEQLRSQLTLDSLISAKARGATFGALSEGELNVLSASASRLGTWAIKDKNGNVVGYKVNEKDFRKELDKINNFAKLDFILKGGDYEQVGVKVMPDGTFWSLNSDGTYTQLK